eukprot:1333282-Rhodomonas_salina.1
MRALAVCAHIAQMCVSLIPRRSEGVLQVQLHEVSGKRRLRRAVQRKDIDGGMLVPMAALTDSILCFHCSKGSLNQSERREVGEECGSANRRKGDVAVGRSGVPTSTPRKSEFGDWAEWHWREFE